MDVYFFVKSSVSHRCIAFSLDLTINPSLGNHDGFKKNLLGFLRF